jgi:hypothetical protein
MRFIQHRGAKLPAIKTFVSEILHYAQTGNSRERPSFHDYSEKAGSL